MTWIMHDLVAVFPTPSIQGAVVSPERLKEDLESELSLTSFTHLMKKP
jgi:hypothetical protein